MERRIVDLPAMRQTQVDWDIDWREQDTGTKLTGARAVLMGSLPRWIGTVPQVLRASDIPGYRAARYYGRGMAGVFRIQMRDPLFSTSTASTVSFDDGAGFDDGALFADETMVFAVSAAAAGAESVVVDETGAPQVIRVGQILSYADWPFVVVARSGDSDALTLTVEPPLRVAIPEGGAIHFRGRGLFEMVNAGSGNPTYDIDRVSRPVLTLREWMR